jgi:hypothetical protein
MQHVNCTLFCQNAAQVLEYESDTLYRLLGVRRVEPTVIIEAILRLYSDMPGLCRCEFRNTLAYILTPTHSQ